MPFKNEKFIFILLFNACLAGHLHDFAESKCTSYQRVPAAMAKSSKIENRLTLMESARVSSSPLRGSKSFSGVHGHIVLTNDRLFLRGGMPNVGMDKWTSEFDRVCWNESNPNILSPLFVPKAMQFLVSCQ